MIIEDIKGGLYSVSQTVWFLDKSIEIERIKHDKGIGFNIKYLNLGITIRLYTHHKELSSKSLTHFEDDEIEIILQEILTYYLSLCTLEKLNIWIQTIKNVQILATENVVRNKIREALFL